MTADISRLILARKTQFSLYSSHLIEKKLRFSPSPAQPTLRSDDGRQAAPKLHRQGARRLCAFPISVTYSDCFFVFVFVSDRWNWYRKAQLRMQFWGCLLGFIGS